MLNQNELIEAVTTGQLFFARTPDGEYIARYFRHGPVEKVTANGLRPLPWQGSDLCWHIRASEETLNDANDANA